MIHQLLNQKIQKMYSMQQEINAQDRDIFHLPIEERLQHTKYQKVRWIEQTSATISKCIEDHHQKVTSGQRDICSFFKKQDKSH